MSIESFLHRSERELTLHKAVLNVTDHMTRLFMRLDCDAHGLGTLEDHWPLHISRIRTEFTRLRRKKGRA